MGGKRVLGCRKGTRGANFHGYSGQINRQGVTSGDEGATPEERGRVYGEEWGGVVERESGGKNSLSSLGLERAIHDLFTALILTRKC
jgi:hypothetical protein